MAGFTLELPVPERTPRVIRVRMATAEQGERRILLVTGEAGVGASWAVLRLLGAGSASAQDCEQCSRQDQFERFHDSVLVSAS